MKTKINKSLFTTIVILIFLSFVDNIEAQTNSSAKKNNIKKFQASIVNSDYAMAYSVLISLTDKELKIIYRSELEGEKDTLLFSKALQPSDTLQQISEINLSKLKKYYSNNCIDDGSQVTVTLKKDKEIKSVHLSNYYHEKIGKIIYLINSLVPHKFKVWYNKETLIADYKRCNGTN